MKLAHIVGFVLLLAGGINWALLGLTGWEVGQLFGGSGAAVSRIIYVLVGVGALLEIVSHKASCRFCGVSQGSI
ncbi:MAG: DUF378 domain-containing protein [Candidatus Ryanbacteria bacterium]|nr:DUF378 domain-containing protein [Candidatus Ryanbacteria bacterium]